MSNAYTVSNFVYGYRLPWIAHHPTIHSLAIVGFEWFVDPHIKRLHFIAAVRREGKDGDPIFLGLIQNFNGEVTLMIIVHEQGWLIFRTF